MRYLKKLCLASCCFLFLSTAQSQQVKHVVLITVDGFRPDFYLDSNWPAPNIRQLMKNGTYALGVNSVFPSMTYPSHTTIVTGVQPAKHGVYYNGMFEPNGSTGKIYWNDSSIHATTIWKAAQQKGLTTAALFWPVSADAPVDYNIPDIGSMGETTRENYAKPAGFVRTLRAEVFNGINAIEYGKDENVARIAAYVIKKAKPSLMTIHLFSVDHAEHIQGREGDMVKEAVADADSSVGVITEALKQAGIWNNTVLIVTGDHGFENVTQHVYPNVWLAQAGLITDIKKGDWKAQFYTVGGSAYLYLKDPQDQATLAKVKDLLSRLPAAEQQYFRIISRSQLDAIGGNPEVALALSGEHGASFGGAATGATVAPGKGGTHGFFPDFRNIQTGFVAYGPGIRKGGIISSMNLRDIAPAIARMLQLDLPPVQGKIPEALLAK